MSRDARIGPEHWRGCHTFENIICDGNVKATGSSRDGGLKMGGTYWYYVCKDPEHRPKFLVDNLQYQLDNDIDFHNSAEPSTTSCPLLPGQLVNVLHMPFHLSKGTHKSRNGSVSSTSSDLRTMDPQDKYLNPRRAPLPKLPRLRTSPPLHQKSDSATSSPIGSVPSSAHSFLSNLGGSQPASAKGLRKFRLPRKPSVEGKSRSLSPTQPTGLRAAFKQLTSPRHIDPPIDIRPVRRAASPKRKDGSDHGVGIRAPNGRVLKMAAHTIPNNVSRPQSPQDAGKATLTESSLSKPLPLRRQPSETSVHGEDKVPMSSFQSHRRAKSRSREPSPLRNSLTLTREESDNISNMLGSFPQARPLEPLVEAPSNQVTPVWPLTAQKVPETEQVASTQQDLAEKRLPTLPNSPTSAYDPSLIDNSPTKSLSDELQQLDSHFSNWTMTTSPGTSPQKAGQSHFSDCTYISVSYSPTLNYNSVFDPQRASSVSNCGSSPEQPQLFDGPSAPDTPSMPSKHDSMISQNTYSLPSESTCSSLSTYQSSATSSPIAENFGLGLGFNPDKRNAGHFQGYQLPDNSEATIKQCPARVAVRRQLSTDLFVNKPNDLQHTSSMQRLIDELSYLGDMIQR
ncbi:MAG: hypothetical protein Q9160_003889 [Pyrenula sp. 1 TL-2023]